jgi:hypothetical protein
VKKKPQTGTCSSATLTAPEERDGMVHEDGTWHDQMYMVTRGVQCRLLGIPQTRRTCPKVDELEPVHKEDILPEGKWKPGGRCRDAAG